MLRVKPASRLKVLGQWGESSPILPPVWRLILGLSQRIGSEQVGMLVVKPVGRL